MLLGKSETTGLAGHLGGQDGEFPDQEQEFAAKVETNISAYQKGSEIEAQFWRKQVLGSEDLIEYLGSFQG